MEKVSPDSATNFAGLVGPRWKRSFLTGVEMKNRGLNIGGISGGLTY